MSSMRTPIIGLLREARWFNRFVAASVITAVLGLTCTPTLLAARTEAERRARSAIPPVSESQALSQALQAAERHLTALDRGLRDGEPGDPRSHAQEKARQTPQAHRAALHELRRELQERDRDAREGFREVERHIRRHGLAGEILARHEAAVAHYEGEMNGLLADLDLLLDATDDTQLSVRTQRALERLQRHQNKPRPRPFDPEHLPFGPVRPEVREPATDTFSLYQHLFEPVLLADLDGAGFVTPGAASATPVEADLAPTVDAPITPAIKALAEKLDHNPVTIYNWVHDNIDFIPSYGSLQGAEMTLQNRAGNAFDTASLLIALLRVSDIPARYAYGTVRIPAEQVMNWVGGVEVPEAAQQLLGQGGIPNTAILQGGEIRWIEMEHIWVEAWVDYVPSRGAVHREGDTWVPLDASFKQYEYREGVDLDTAIPFDAEGFAAEIVASATINESEGWVQGMDMGLIQQRMQDHEEQVATFISGLADGATIEDVFGGRAVMSRQALTLDSALPYEHVVREQAFSDFPARLRHRFRFTLQDQYGLDVLTFEENTASIAGKRLAISFRVATDADAELIASYLPDAEPGQQLTLDDLPRSVPGYLINVVAEWSIDGEVVAASSPFPMGTQFQSRRGLRSPAWGWTLTDGAVTAGEYHAFGLDLQGVSQDQLKRLHGDLLAVQEWLEMGYHDEATRHDLVGNTLQAGILIYFAVNRLQESLEGLAGGVVAHAQPAWGVFASNVRTSYWFGIPRDTEFSGVLMDVDQYGFAAASADGDSNRTTVFRQAAGARLSANEHSVPEELFARDGRSSEGVSAVKALAVASAEGQRIYAIDEANYAGVFPLLKFDDATTEDIRDAVWSGKIVTVHERSITHYGWRGVGYIISDPRTGSGAYMISGGARGGELIDDIGKLLGIIGNTIQEAYKWVGKLLSVASTAIDVVSRYIRCGFKEAVIITYAESLLAAGIFSSFYFKFALYFLGASLAVIAFFISIFAIFIVGLIGMTYRSGCRIK